MLHLMCIFVVISEGQLLFGGTWRLLYCDAGSIQQML
jgi:hypothetical protein